MHPNDYSADEIPGISNQTTKKILQTNFNDKHELSYIVSITILLNHFQLD